MAPKILPIDKGAYCFVVGCTRQRLNNCCMGPKICSLCGSFTISYFSLVNAGAPILCAYVAGVYINENKRVHFHCNHAEGLSI